MKLGLLSEKEKKPRYIIVSLFGISVLILLLIISFYNNPSADDYNYSVNVRQYGFWGAQYYWYIHWCGRYFSTFILSMSPLVFGSFLGYKLMSFFIILFSLGSSYLLVNKVFHNSQTLEKLYITFLCFISLVLFMPSMPEAYYWLAAAYSYQTANILTVLLFVLIISYNEKHSILLFLLSSLIVFLIAGTNEYALILLLLVLFTLNILYFVKNRKPNIYYSTLFLIAVIGFSTVYFAPGNAYRSSFQPDKHQLLFSIRNSLHESFDVLGNWWWLGCFIALTGFMSAGKTLTDKNKSSFADIYLNPIAVMLFIFVGINIGFFSCYWSLGLYPPLRVINTIYFLFVFGSLYLGVCTAVFLKDFNIKVQSLSFFQLLIPLLLAIYLIKYPNNIKTAFHDFNSKRALKYDIELKERYKKLYTDNCRVCEIKRLENTPATLYFTDISEKTDPAMLRSYTLFFNKDSIFVEDK